MHLIVETCEILLSLFFFLKVSVKVSESNLDLWGKTVIVIQYRAVRTECDAMCCQQWIGWHQKCQLHATHLSAERAESYNANSQ